MDTPDATRAADGLSSHNGGIARAPSFADAYGQTMLLGKQATERTS